MKIEFIDYSQFERAGELIRDERPASSDLVFAGLESLSAELKERLSPRWDCEVAFDLSDGYYSRDHKVFAAAITCPSLLCAEFFEEVQAVLEDSDHWALDIAAEPELEMELLPSALLWVTADRILCSADEGEDEEYYRAALAMSYSDRQQEMRQILRRLSNSRMREGFRDLIARLLWRIGIRRSRITLTEIPAGVRLTEKRLFRNSEGQWVFQARLHPLAGKGKATVSVKFISEGGESIEVTERALFVLGGTTVLFNIMAQTGEIHRAEVAVVQGREGDDLVPPDSDWISKSKR